MQLHFVVRHSAIIVLVSVCASVAAQPWIFAREKDGIRIYTHQQENSSFKSFHGETAFRGDFKKVSGLIGDPSNLGWWAGNVKNIQVLLYEKDRQIRYYFEYQVPWPFTNRDLVTEVKIDEDSITGAKTIFSTPLPGAVPIKSGKVRVTDYWQKWTILPLENGMIHITLEGYIDPAGDVPAWLYNIVVVDIPLKLLREVREAAQN